MERKTSPRRTMEVSLLLIAAAQFSLSPFVVDFRISIAVTCFSAAVYFLEDVSILSAALLSAVGTFLTRTVFYYAGGAYIFRAMHSAGPEIIFFLIYGTGLFLFIRLVRRPFQRPLFLLYTACLDFLSNLVEMTLRSVWEGDIARALLVLGAAAVFRTLLLWGSLAFFDRYQLILLRRSNAERYQRLMMLISRLSGEVTWMQKNSAQVEQVMNASYGLYQRLQEAGHEEMASQALSVAKDIHEIKKEYLLIMRGLSEAMEDERSQEGMELSELLNILRRSLQNTTPLSRQATFQINCADKLFTHEVYPLLSVFHNLISNALEAGGGGCMISVEEWQEEDGWHISVTDDGPGIPEEDAARLFDPGFSTKINYETGVVARGLGLPIVRDIVEKTLHGSISVKTSEAGTVFCMVLPFEALEVMRT